MKKLYLEWHNRNASEVLSEKLIINKNEIEIRGINMVRNRSVHGRNSITNVENTNMILQIEEDTQDSKFTICEVQDMHNRKIMEIERRLKDIETGIQK